MNKLSFFYNATSKHNIIIKLQEMSNEFLVKRKSQGLLPILGKTKLFFMNAKHINRWASAFILKFFISIKTYFNGWFNSEPMHTKNVSDL